MKKRMVRLLSVVMAIAMAFGMAISAYAFEGEYFSTTECWDYTEEETTIANSVEAVIGTEIAPDENSAGLNNYNVYALEMDLQGMSAQDLLTASGDNYETEMKKAVESEYAALGWSVDFVSFNASVAYDSYELYSFIYLQSEQAVTDSSGNTTTVYQNMAIFPAETYAVYVTVTNYDSAEECEAVLYEIVDYIEIPAYAFNDDLLGDYTSEDIMGMGMAVMIGVLVFFLVILVVIIVIIVVAVKSSKKKKAQRMAQQAQYNFDPRTGQPIQNNQNQPWQYNPYGQQPPVNNNQYNPYGQQGNNYAPYTPSQPATSEMKDPLDLDNKE